LATEPGRLRVVLDTNVVFAGLFSRNPHSPTAEVLRRWQEGEFDLLYCEDLQAEYRDKLASPNINPTRRGHFLTRLTQLGIYVPLTSDDLIPRVPDDPDDDVVIACAVAGGATHLVTYASHRHALGKEYEGVRILDGLHFLYILRGDVPPLR